jgi:hypothetical protein
MACVLSLLLALPAISPAQTAVNSVITQEESSTVSSSATAIEPLTVTAQRTHAEEEARIARLKTTRAAGGLLAGSGVGLMAYAVLFAGAGPIGWAAGLMFLGGLTAYLAHRRLKKKDDFSETTNRAAFPPATTAPAPQVPFPTDQPYGR